MFKLFDEANFKVSLLSKAYFVGPFYSLIWDPIIPDKVTAATGCDTVSQSLPPSRVTVTKLPKLQFKIMHCTVLTVLTYCT